MIILLRFNVGLALKGLKALSNFSLKVPSQMSEMVLNTPLWLICWPHWKSKSKAFEKIIRCRRSNYWLDHIYLGSLIFFSFSRWSIFAYWDNIFRVCSCVRIKMVWHFVSYIIIINYHVSLIMITFNFTLVDHHWQIPKKINSNTYHHRL